MIGQRQQRLIHGPLMASRCVPHFRPFHYWFMISRYAMSEALRFLRQFASAFIEIMKSAYAH